MSEIVETRTYAEQIEAKKKRKKIIISSVALGLVLSIAIVVLTLGLVKVDLKPAVITNPTKIYFNGNSAVQYDKNDEIYNDFMDTYEKAFNISYLTGIFSGRLGGYEIVESHSEDSKSLPSELTSGNYVTFLYNGEKITLTDNKGKTVYSHFDTNQSIDFYQVSFALSNENKLEDITMYLKHDFVSSSSATTSYYAKVILKANTYELNQIYQNI